MSNLQEQLKNIGQVVDKQAKDRIGENLMYQIRNYERASQVEDVVRANFLEPLKFVRLAWKPVGVFAFIGLFFLSISGLTMVAAQNTVPGDTLFAVKKVIEKSQGLMAADSARRVELAGEFFGNRVDELQQVLVQESQLKSNGQTVPSEKVSLAVAEVKKQLDDVNIKFAKLKSEDGQGNGTAVAALILDEKIRSYKQELEEAKSKIIDQEVSNVIDEALEQVEEINNDVLEVIVDKHEKGELALASEDLENKLDEHVAVIEEKVVEAEEAIAAKFEMDGQEFKDQASQAKEKLVQAREAISKNEYALVLTLSKDSNEILKILYGEIDKVIIIEEELVVPEEAGQVEGVTTSSVEVIESAPVLEEVEVIEEVVEEIQEFEVKIQ